VIVVPGLYAALDDAAAKLRRLVLRRRTGTV
jgi:hypothetical protein